MAHPVYQRLQSARWMGCLLWLGTLSGCQRHPVTDQGAGQASASSTAPVAANLAHAAQIATRVVTLTPGLTELMYAVGAESALVATVDYADYPEAARSVPRVGNAFRIDLERLLSYQPDLVLVWTSGTPAATVEQIKALGVRVVSVDALRLTDVAAALRTIGQLTGHAAQAEAAAVQFTAGIDSLRQRYASAIRLPTFIEVSRQPLYTVNGQHVLSEVVSLCGGDNVFADLNQLAPSIGVEAVLQRAPAVILATEGTVPELLKDWGNWYLPAVQQRQVYAVSPDLTTRATPRLLQGAEAICTALQQARAAQRHSAQ